MYNYAILQCSLDDSRGYYNIQHIDISKHNSSCLDPVPATCYLGYKFKSVEKFVINVELVVIECIINLCISVY